MWFLCISPISSSNRLIGTYVRMASERALVRLRTTTRAWSITRYNQGIRRSNKRIWRHTKSKKCGGSLESSSLLAFWPCFGGAHLHLAAANLNSQSKSLRAPWHCGPSWPRGCSPSCPPQLCPRNAWTRHGRTWSTTRRQWRAMTITKRPALCRIPGLWCSWIELNAAAPACN